MEMQILVRQRVPSRHGRENVPDRSDERSSTHEHDDHRLYVNVLQVRIFTLIYMKIGIRKFRFISVYVVALN